MRRKYGTDELKTRTGAYAAEVERRCVEWTSLLQKLFFRALNRLSAEIERILAQKRDELFQRLSNRSQLAADE
jgi:hypothetical protein